MPAKHDRAMPDHVPRFGAGIAHTLRGVVKVRNHQDPRARSADASEQIPDRVRLELINVGRPALGDQGAKRLFPPGWRGQLREEFETREESGSVFHQPAVLTLLRSRVSIAEEYTNPP